MDSECNVAVASGSGGVSKNGVVISDVRNVEILVGSFVKIRRFRLADIQLSCQIVGRMHCEMQVDDTVAVERGLQLLCERVFANFRWRDIKTVFSVAFSEANIR